MEEKKTEEKINAEEWKKDNRNTVMHIKENYRKLEQGIVNDLCFKVPHGSTIGHFREHVWEKMFKNIVPLKFEIEQSVFIIDSKGNVSKEVDLAIFDKTYTPYIFHYGHLKFIPVEAVAAAIECKSSSLSKEHLEKWAQSIQALETDKRSVARMFQEVVCGEDKTTPTQTATRPIRILCYVKERDEQKQWLEEEHAFDIVIRADSEKEQLQIQWSQQNKNLYDWYESLNHAERQCEKKEGHSAVANGTFKDREYTLEKYRVRHKGEELSLLSFNFQFNQLLMLINNPMLFPHIAYAEMFDKYGDLEERR